MDRNKISKIYKQITIKSKIQKTLHYVASFTDLKNSKHYLPVNGRENTEVP